MTILLRQQKLLENFINLEQSYRWLTIAKKVRDAKYPEYLNSSISVNINNFDLCEIFAVTVSANIFKENESDDPITIALFYEENPVERIVLTNEDAEVPGIDLTTAFTNQDVITVATVLFCKNNEIYFYGESDIVFAEDNQNIFENLAKIEEDLISIKKVLTLRQIKLNKNLKETIQKKSQYSSKTKKSKKDKNDLKVWSSKILQEINSNINYPVIALQNQISGKVIIQLSITNKGILKKLSLIQSSGFDILDNEVLRAVSNSDHYPSAPLSLSKKQYSFKLPIKFEI